jgi:predicted MFS family arabinose efflux permease
VFFGFRARGNMIGSFYGGRIQEKLGLQFCHFVAVLFSCVMLFPMLFFVEQRISSDKDLQ